MGVWLSFKRSLAIDPVITDEDKESYREFSRQASFPTNPKANYLNPWYIDDEGRLGCHAVKFFEHDRWMEYIFDKFFEPKGYEVHGTLLYAGDGAQTEWKVLKYDNGKVFHIRMEDIHIDLDFWEIGAEYARAQMMKTREEGRLHVMRQEKIETPAEAYGGLFEV